MEMLSGRVSTALERVFLRLCGWDIASNILSESMGVSVTAVSLFGSK